MLDGTVLEKEKRVERTGEAGDFSHFVLQKIGWNTTQALDAVADKLGVSRKRFSYAGTKDRQATSVQLCSAWSVLPEKLLEVRVKDLQVLGSWGAKEKVSMGDLAGNRFTVNVSGLGKCADKNVKEIYAELGGVFPNYFGGQRFGSLRQHSHVIGELILRNELKKAVFVYLAQTSKNEPAEATKAREQLAQDNDCTAALSYFPRNLKYERTLLGHLTQNPRDYAGALRKLPRSLLLLFVHAYQAHLFNKLLSKKIKEKTLDELLEGEYYCAADSLGFPDLTKRAEAGFPVGRVIGYETKLNEEEKKLLEDEGINASDFRLRALPEISCKGTPRALLAPLVGFSFKQKKKEGAFSFSLPSGCYATVALAEFLEKNKKKGMDLSKM